MQDRLQELSRKIEGLTRGLGEAQELLTELAQADANDPSKELRAHIAASLAKLNPRHLQSVADYVAFLADRQAKGLGGPGGGENQPPTSEGGP